MTRPVRSRRPDLAALALAALALAVPVRADEAAGGGAPGAPGPEHAGASQAAATPPRLLLRAAAVHVGDGRVHRPGAVLIEGDHVQAVADSLDAPEGAEVRDLGDAVLTPGLFDPEATVDVSAGEARSGPNAALLSAADARDPWDPWLAVLREGGVTGACLVPSPAGGPISGRAAAVDTTGPGATGAARLDESGTLVTSLASPGPGSTQRALARGQLDQLLEAAVAYRKAQKEYADQKKEEEKAPRRHRHAKKGAKGPGDRKPPRQDAFEVLGEVLDRKLPLRIEAWRREDARDALALARARGVTVSLAGCTECAALAEELEASTAIVVVRPLAQPVGDGRGTPEPDAARRLALAGVRLAVTAGGPWPEGPTWLRVAAADLVGAGVDPDAAVAAMTGLAAESCGVPEKKRLLVPGATTPVLVWSGDPLDPAATLLERVEPTAPPKEADEPAAADEPDAPESDTPEGDAPGSEDAA